MTRRQSTILLIDNNNRFVERMIHLLKEAEIMAEIKVAADFTATQGILQTGMPDLILLDIGLHSKSGVEVLKTIKQTGGNCKIIVLSNQTDEKYRKKCLALGADHFLDKSYEFSLVPDLIRNLKIQ